MRIAEAAKLFALAPGQKAVIVNPDDIRPMLVGGVRPKNGAKK